MTDYAKLIRRLDMTDYGDVPIEALDAMSDASNAIKALVAERDEALRHVEQLQHKLDPEHSCACCYDRPDITCGHHSPMLAKAEAERDEARALLREAMDWMPAQWPGENGRKLSDIRARIDALLADKEGTT